VYLLGLTFKIVTDCEAVQKTLYRKEVSPKVARWALAIKEFSYSVEHRPGKSLKHVDALSRFPTMLVEDRLLVMIRKKQEEEESIRVIKQLLSKGPYENYVIGDGILMKQADTSKVIVLPTCMHFDVIKRHGTFWCKENDGVNQSKDYYIPNLIKKLEDFVHCCVPCVLAEKKKGKRERRLVPISKEDQPLQTYHVDYLGPMNATEKMYKYLLVVIDGFSKFVWIYPTKTTSAKEVLNKLQNQQKTFGNPARIVTDRGSAFTSSDFKDYCAEEQID